MKLHETDRLLILSCYDFASVKFHFFILVSDTNNDILGKKGSKSYRFSNKATHDKTTQPYLNQIITHLDGN